MPKPQRQDMFLVTCTVDDIDTGIWDKASGGMIDSNEKKYKPGGMEPEISLGGTKTVENITLTRYTDLDRDGALKKPLMNKVGMGIATVTKQPLDVNGVPYGEPDVYQGTLKSYKGPEAESEGGDEAPTEMEISSAGVVR